MLVTGPSNVKTADFPLGVGKARILARQLRGEDQIRAVVAVLAERDLVLQQVFDRRDQEQLLEARVHEPLCAGDPEFPEARVVFEDAPEAVRLVLRGADESRCVGIADLGLQEHEVSEAEPLDQAARFEAADARVEFGAEIVLLLAPGDEGAIEVFRGRQQAACCLLREQELLDLFEDDVRADDRQRTPVDRAGDRVAEVFDAPVVFRARLEERVEGEIVEDALDALGAEADAPDVAASGHEELLHRQRRFPLRQRGLPQRAVPVLHTCERIGLAARVEHHQGSGDVVQVELVDEAVVGLSGEVPQQGFLRLALSVGCVDGGGAERPDIAAVRGIRFLP